jgi:hypothetical protein
VNSLTIEDRLTGLRAGRAPSARLYAVVDALLLAHCEPAPALQRGPAALALFDGTEDASLAEHGPWLLHYEEASPELRCSLHVLSQGVVGMVWLISAHAPEALAAMLRDRLGVRLPNGATALLRFYDPRRLVDIAGAMSAAQRAHLLAPALQWVVEREARLSEVMLHV